MKNNVYILELNKDCDYEADIFRISKGNINFNNLLLSWEHF